MKKMKDKTKFKEILGNSIEIKILEYLIETEGNKLTFNDIVKATGINRKRGYEILRRYLRKNILIKVNQVKQIKLYQFNKNNDTVTCLLDLFNSIII